MFEVGKKYRYKFEDSYIDYEVTYVQDEVIVFRYLKNSDDPILEGKSSTFSSNSLMAEESKEIFSDIEQDGNVLTITRPADDYVKEKILRMEAIRFVPDISERAVTISLRLNNPGGSFEEIKFALSQEERLAIKNFLERYPH